MSIHILVKEIEQRIKVIENDKYLDKEKKATIIRENKRILVRCQQFELSKLENKKSEPMEREQDTGRYGVFDYLHSM